jgi:pilus assembly protein CpaE
MSPQRVNRVLVVENNVQATKTFRKLLSLIENVEVIDFLNTAQEALEMISEIKPDILLVEEHLPDIDGISFTEIIRRDYPTTQVIIVSQDKHYDTVLRALRNGASDFLAHDVSIGEFREAILRAGEMAAIERTKYHPYFAPETTKIEEGEGTSKANVICVYSPRGGVGATTVANNLALSFRDNESQISLIDTSLQFGDVDILFNEVGQLSLLDLTPIAYELDSKVVKEVMILHRSSGLYLLAPPKRPLLQEPITGEQISRVLDYVRSFYDYLVINTSNYINEATLASLDLADVIVLVITQEIASIKSMRSFLELWDGFGMKRERLMLVVNKFNKNGALTPRKISETLGQPVDLTIPEDDEAALRAANLGNPLLMSNPNADISQAIVDLSNKIKQKLPALNSLERFRLYLKNN